jgi:hypothetical protein
MSRLTRVVAPLLGKAGLDVRPMVGADGQVHELVVTNRAIRTGAAWSLTGTGSWSGTTGGTSSPIARRPMWRT